MRRGASAKGETGERPVLVCRVGDMRIALLADRVAEVLSLPALATLPGQPAPLAGFAAVGDRAMPVVRLDQLFEPGAAQGVRLDAHLVLLHPGGSLALLVDRAEAFETPEPGARSPVDQGSSLAGAAVATLALADGEAASLLDLDRLLLAEERIRLEALTREAERRGSGWLAAGA